MEKEKKLTKEKKKNEKGYTTFQKGTAIRKIFSIKGQVEQYHKINPFFYDKTKMFWKWEDDKKKYSMCDEVDLLNNIEEELGIED